MQIKTLFVSALAGLAGLAYAAPHLEARDGVTDKVKPDGDAPASCKGTLNGKFEFSIADINAKRDLSKRADCGGNGVVVLTLEDGVLKDGQDRTGYIASNFQFQFDGPPQADAIYTAGFSVCGNGSIALGGSTTFYKCTSGSFANLYDRHWAAQCSPVQLLSQPCGAGSAGQAGDGQVVGTSFIQTTLVTAISDGQPQVVTTSVGVPLCQIGDGQVQVHTTPCSAIPSAQPAPTQPHVSQISDGQIQVPTETAAPPPPPTETAAPPPPTETAAPPPTETAAPPPEETTPVGSTSEVETTVTAPPATTTSVAPTSPSVVPPTSTGVSGGALVGPEGSLAALGVGILGALLFV